LAVVDDKVVIKIHLPYTDDSVTIQVNPSVQKYVEKPATNVRQMMITTPTSETTTLSLDLKTNRRKQFSSGEGTEYEIELLKISKQGIYERLNSMSLGTNQSREDHPRNAGDPGTGAEASNSASCF